MIGWQNGKNVDCNAFTLLVLKQDKNFLLYKDIVRLAETVCDFTV